MLPTGSSDQPETGGPRHCLLFGLASDGVYMCPVCYQTGGSLLHCPSALTTSLRSLGIKPVAVYFCCTGLRVTSTGRYPASCPMKPGLSSPAVFRHMQPRLFSQLVDFILTFLSQKVNKIHLLCLYFFIL